MILEAGFTVHTMLMDGPRNYVRSVARIRGILRKLAAMRSYMRGISIDGEREEDIATAVGMTGAQIEEMYRLLAIAKYEERYVIPSAHTEQAHALEEMACSLDFDGGPGMGGAGPFGSSSGPSVPVAVENFHILADRQTADRPSSPGRVNLLNWDGNGNADGLFPPTSMTAVRETGKGKDKNQGAGEGRP